MTETMTTQQATPAKPRGALARNTTFLALGQLFSGVGIASGIAVGGLLAEELTGSTEFAGLSQTASILGAAIAAIPLANLARKYTRRRALTTGFSLAAVGALIILVSTTLNFAPGYFMGMLFIGVATATGLQSRYAATDDAPDHIKGRMMSFVVWATTIGSVAGPNLTEPGAHVGRALGLHPLAGPFVLSVCAFAIAAFFASRVKSEPVPGAVGEGPAAGSPGRAEDVAVAEAPAPGVRQVLGIVCRNKVALFGLVTVATAQMMMSSVMVMTPVHMAHDGMALHFVGIVISLHILGMYGLSPLFGWMADKWGGQTVAILGYAIFAIAFALGIYDAIAGSQMPRISTALTLLGVGWSACFIGGSMVLNGSVPAAARVPLQGLSDSIMNFGAAIMAAASGSLLELGGFQLINIVAACLLVLTLLAGARAKFGFGAAHRVA
ncbi:MFS transporter [Brevibacterium sp. 50QC2O2]|uniref:MFS transporter n=1 Tax=Brevibacterium sp. 50QC2O2 TaxID=2968459 RepID=UPI00211C3D2E|nr:MFS transporter [Brevibacterium sp. 50QC2O2]MCQ9389562.1 MFS transporter [Brevibacterium sp. 50QC2O2]